MNKIEELEHRCEQLENRIQALEAAVHRLVCTASPEPRIGEHIRNDMWLNGIPVHRGCEYPAFPDGEMFKVHGSVTWYGGQ